MIKTKCVWFKPKPEDGTRILVMRHGKEWNFQPFDEWIKDLAPSYDLLNKYKSGTINFKIYAELYLEEMKEQKGLIKKLAIRAKTETITLLCYEKTDEKCHRRLLKELIEKEVA